MLPATSGTNTRVRQSRFSAKGQSASWLFVVSFVRHLPSDSYRPSWRKWVKGIWGSVFCYLQGQHTPGSSACPSSGCTNYIQKNSGEPLSALAHKRTKAALHRSVSHKHRGGRWKQRVREDGLSGRNGGGKGVQDHAYGSVSPIREKAIFIDTKVQARIRFTSEYWWHWSTLYIVVYTTMFW